MEVTLVARIKKSIAYDATKYSQNHNTYSLLISY